MSAAAANQAVMERGQRLRRWTSRPYRLVGLAVLLALAFVPGRLYILAILGLLAIASGIRSRREGGSRLVWAVLAIMGVGALVQAFAYRDALRVARYYDENTPVDVASVADGDYIGTTRAMNGPLEVQVEVKDGAILDARVLRYQEVVYAFDELLERIKGARTTDLTGAAGFVFRNERDVAAFQRAVEDALLSTRRDRPELSVVTKAAFFVSENSAGRITLNSLAILFIILVLLDFVLQPTLSPGTGQSLTCYNCQACVGVCPVKMVDGDPFPMIMILEARVGNYERVAELAKFCVACGKCSAKCPVGNSGPSVASASVVLDRQRRRDEARRSASKAREVPGV